MKVLGGKYNVCPHCRGTMVYLNIKGIGTVSQCRSCGCMINRRMKDEIISYEKEPIRDKGSCKIKNGKSQELREYLALDFGRGKHFEYKVVANNIVTVYKKGISFYITKGQLDEYFEL